MQDVLLHDRFWNCTELSIQYMDNVKLEINQSVCHDIYKKRSCQYYRQLPTNGHKEQGQTIFHSSRYSISHFHYPGGEQTCIMGLRMTCWNASRWILSRLRQSIGRKKKKKKSHMMKNYPPAFCLLWKHFPKHTVIYNTLRTVLGMVLHATF